jgi:hypothetical protein
VDCPPRRATTLGRRLPNLEPLTGDQGAEVPCGTIKWVGLAAVGKVERIRETVGKTLLKSAYYLLSAHLDRSGFVIMKRPPALGAVRRKPDSIHGLGAYDLGSYRLSATFASIRTSRPVCDAGVSPKGQAAATKHATCAGCGQRVMLSSYDRGLTCSNRCAP